ncbi:hypothetical protein [Aeromonas sp. HMWF015]|uniref:hypothetical protein n=1 Tax=Aeromonas sp. HMWF015 TaxID=2056851 RepID=UPI0011B290AB|nr:hypothetical protein [Aeromonas sp. HMWF015]
MKASLFIALAAHPYLTRHHVLLPPVPPARDTDLILLRPRHLPLSGDDEEQLSTLSRPFSSAITNKKVRFLTKFNPQLTD